MRFRRTPTYCFQATRPQCLRRRLYGGPERSDRLLGGPDEARARLRPQAVRRLKAHPRGTNLSSLPRGIGGTLDGWAYASSIREFSRDSLSCTSSWQYSLGETSVTEIQARFVARSGCGAWPARYKWATRSRTGFSHVSRQALRTLASPLQPIAGCRGHPSASGVDMFSGVGRWSPRWRGCRGQIHELVPVLLTPIGVIRSHESRS
jgi:hypothetical protein